MRKLIKECPECSSQNIFRNVEKGETICRECGFVIEDRMVDFSQEWRDFEDDEGGSKRRTGAPSSQTQFDQGLGTEVGTTSDFYKLSSEKERDKFFRLRKWNIRISTAIERNLKVALAELKRVSSFLRLPRSVEEEASRIYTMAVQRGLVRGRSMESVIAACIYAACRTYNIPRTLDEIAATSDVERKEIGRTYRFITRKLAINITPSNPKDYISRFSSVLHLSPKAQNDALKILKRAELSELTSGRGPAGIAAAALYVAALLNGEKRTQREVADVAGITEVTIRNRYKELIEKLGLEEKMKIQEVERKKGSK